VQCDAERRALVARRDLEPDLKLVRLTEGATFTVSFFDLVMPWGVPEMFAVV